MASSLPAAPRYVFSYIEPASLIVGAVAPLFDPSYFVTSQIAHVKPHGLYETEHVLALQLGNLYFLMALMGLFILNTTTEVKVVRAYLWALWIGDIGHIGATAWVMGWEQFVDVTGWNAMARGNVGFTAFLFITRSLYFLGLFGMDNEGKRGSARTKKKST